MGGSEEITKIYEHYGHREGDERILSALPALESVFPGGGVATLDDSLRQLRRQIVDAATRAPAETLQLALAVLTGRIKPLTGEKT